MAMMVELDKIREFPIRLHHFDEEHGDIKFVMGIESLMEYIEHLPSVEAEPVKHGNWGENIYGYRKCSVCGRVTQVDECMREPLYLYCPYCGAEMRKVTE